MNRQYSTTKADRIYYMKNHRNDYRKNGHGYARSAHRHNLPPLY